MLFQGGVAEVMLDGAIEGIGLADEEVGALGHLDQGLGPGGVAGVGDGFVAVGQSQRVGRCAAGVRAKATESG